MPKYFFDVHNGHEHHIDMAGTELPDQHAARDEATRAIAEIAADSIPGDGPQRDIAIHIRDRFGEPLLELTLKFKIRPAV